MKIKLLKDAKDSIKELTDFLDKYEQTNYVVKNGKVIYKDDLILSYNSVQKLPDSFGNLEIKGNLYLHNNQLTSLPESFGNLKIKGKLSLRHNQLTSLPSSILKMSLDMLSLDNQAKEMYEALKEWEAEKVVDSQSELQELIEFLNDLDLVEGTDFQVLGDTILMHRQINASYHMLSELPRGIGMLNMGGHRLDLSGNYLASLPDTFANIMAATSIGLSMNDLTSLPDNFGELRVRDFIDLRGNPIVRLPVSILKMDPGQLKIDSQIKEVYKALQEWEK